MDNPENRVHQRISLHSQDEMESCQAWKVSGLSSIQTYTLQLNLAQNQQSDSNLHRHYSYPYRMRVLRFIDFDSFIDPNTPLNSLLEDHPRYPVFSKVAFEQDSDALYHFKPTFVDAEQDQGYFDLRTSMNQPPPETCIDGMNASFILYAQHTDPTPPDVCFDVSRVDEEGCLKTLTRLHDGTDYYLHFPTDAGSLINNQGAYLRVYHRYSENPYETQDETAQDAQPITLCGNGRLDWGEECDPYPHFESNSCSKYCLDLQCKSFCLDESNCDPTLPLSMSCLWSTDNE